MEGIPLDCWKGGKLSEGFGAAIWGLVLMKVLGGHVTMSCCYKAELNFMKHYQSGFPLLMV